jgi:hypothetical protein
VTQDQSGATSSPSRPSPPSDPWAQGSPTSAMSATPPAELEWERVVHIREYRRPTDGKLVRDRECSIRKLYPHQPPMIAEAVQA